MHLNLIRGTLGIGLLIFWTGCESNPILASNPLTNLITKPDLPQAASPVEPSREFASDFDHVWEWTTLAIERQGGMVVDSNRHLGFITYSTSTLFKFYTTIYVRPMPSTNHTMVYCRVWYNGVPLYGDMEHPFFDAVQAMSQQNNSAKQL
jgi:hypothetical protein